MLSHHGGTVSKGTVNSMVKHLCASPVWLGTLHCPHVACSCTGDAPQLESPQTATSASDSTTPTLYNIRFASPDMEQDVWDFLLFSPSAQHTAALCLQRGPAEAPTGASSSCSTDSCDSPSGSKIESMGSRASDQLLHDSSGSTASSDSVALEGSNETRVMQDNGSQERQCNWRMQCWRTVPLMYDECMDPSKVPVQGSSFM